MTATAETQTEDAGRQEIHRRTRNLVVLYDITREAGNALAGACARRGMKVQDPDRRAYWKRRHSIVKQRVRELDPKDGIGLLTQCDAWDDELRELKRKFPLE